MKSSVSKIIVAIYGIWIALSLASASVGIASWWVGTSWLWLPLGVAVAYLSLIFVMALIAQARADKAPDAEEEARNTCVFAKTAEIPDADGQVRECLGKRLGYSCPCSVYTKKGE